MNQKVPMAHLGKNALYRVFSLMVILSMLAGGLAPMAQPEVAHADPATDAPKNVIILISDGMGYNQMDAASYYQYGRTGAQVYEQFPYQFAMSTYEADDNGYDPEEAWKDFNYVRKGYTDSASAATAMSTGYKTYNGSIGVGMFYDDPMYAGQKDIPVLKPLKHMFEYAEESGKRTGVVTSVPYSHATPAAFVAHNVSRNNYTELTHEMIYTSTVDVVMGAGHPHYDNSHVYTTTATYKYISQADYTELVSGNATGVKADDDSANQKWSYTDTITGFQDLATNASTPERVFGIAQTYSTLQESRSGDLQATVPYTDPFNTGVPSLTLMTKAALNVLDNDADGLYLMVEGGAVDWAGHANATGRLIEEQIDFNHSVEAVVAWVEDTGNGSNWDNTLVIVTADHETGYLMGPGSCPGSATDPGEWKPLKNNGIGNTPDAQWCNKVEGGYANHTNSLIPFFAKGKGASYFDYYADQIDPVRGRYIDNIEMAKLIIGWLKPEPPARPKNVIIMISDGWGYNHIAATDYYQYGEPGRQVYQSFLFEGGMSTFAADGAGYDPNQAWNDFDYVNHYATDSAAAATAMSTGQKTYGGSIGMDTSMQKLKHLFEYAEEQGKKTGVVSSVEFSHATPAAFIAHNISRNNYADIANEMIYQSPIDVIMGAGNPEFDNSGKPSTTSSYKYVGGETTWADLKDGSVQGADANGDSTPDTWTVIQTLSEFRNLMTDANPPERLIGVPQVYQTLHQSRGSTGGGYGDGDEPYPYYTALLTDTVPTLTEMTQGALNVLDNDTDGFYLMVEGGAVDWTGHANQSSRMIEEQIDFNHSVEAVVEWVEQNSSWDETLVIVTGDHETGYLTGKDSNDNAVNPPTDWNGTSGKAIVDKMKWNSGSHTNSIIPFYAHGKGAEYFEYLADQIDPMRGRYIDNTEIPQIIFDWDTIASQYVPWQQSWGSLHWRSSYKSNQYDMLKKIGGITMPEVDTDPDTKTASEISAYDTASKKLFVTDSEQKIVHIINLSDPANPAIAGNIDVSSKGGPNSVAVSNGVVAVALEADPKQNDGIIAFYDTNGTHINDVTVGPLPDMITFTPDGTKLLVALEGEPNDAYDNDPEGAVSVINLAGGVAAATASTVSFTDFNAGGSRADELPAGVRIFGKNATVAKDLEPEYITASDDTAWVALQENNALAVIDLSGSGPYKVTKIAALGTKDHSHPFNGIDASDKDSTLGNIKTWPVRGMYMPDAIGKSKFGMACYISSANEGDSRDYDGYSEEERVAKLTLEPTMPNSDTLVQEANIGRLKTTTATGDYDGDGDIDEIHSYGARSFSIWTAQGAMVYDSGDQMEQYIKNDSTYKDYFNHDEFEADGRSDDKGVEPEGLVTASISGRNYAFVGLERMGGIMVYDITYPQQPTFVQYINTTDFAGKKGDIAPEGLIFIPAEHSPNKQPLVVVSYEEPPGDIAVFAVNNVHFDAAEMKVAENVGTADINVKLSATSGQTATVHYTTEGGNVTVLEDLTPAIGTLTFKPGETSKTISIPVVDDTTAEGDEMTYLRLWGANNTTIGATAKMTLTIEDDEKAEINLGSASYNVAEAGGQATVTAKLGAKSAKEVKVDYTTADGTATAGSDYTEAKGTLTFAPGEMEKTFTVAVTQDSEDEGNETVKLALSNPVNTAIGNVPTATLTIADDDQKVMLISKMYTTTEKSKTAAVTVKLSKPSSNEVSVAYATSDGTAKAGSDYTAANGTLTFKPGETSKAINVSISEDTEEEEDETFGIKLSAPVSATLGMPYTGTVTILGNIFDLRIMHTNDTHTQLEPYNVYGVGWRGGIAERKTLVDQARAESAAQGEDVLLLDAGDVFQGTLFYNQYKGLASLWFYNQLMYDVMAVGNHEFDDGPQNLARFINGDVISATGFTIDGEQVAGATFPLVSANVDVSKEASLAGKIKPWVIIERSGEKIGIFGLTAQDTDELSSPGANITFSNPITAAKTAVSELQDQGVNKIIALTHVGYNQDKEIAAQVSDIDLIISGHSHTNLEGDGTDSEGAYPTIIKNPDGVDTRIVSSWEKGYHLGNIHLVFDSAGNVISSSGQPFVVDKEQVAADPTFEAKLNDFKAPVEALNNKVIGKTAVLLDGERANVRSKETNLGNMICDAMLDRVSTATGATIAIQNGGGIRATIQPGDVTVGQVRTVLPYGNRVSVLELTGTQVKEALENGVSQVEDGAGRFPQVGGIRFTWDISSTVGSRVTSIQVKDSTGAFVDIDPNATYTIATNNYLVGGGDGYTVFGQGKNAYDTGFLLAEVVEDYITKYSPVSPVVEKRIMRAGEADVTKATLDPDKENNVEFDKKVMIGGKEFAAFKLFIPKGALPPNAKGMKHTPLVSPTHKALKGAFRYFKIELLDESDNVIEKPTFTAAFTIEMRYADDEAQGVDETKIDVAYWNGTDWEKVGPTTTCPDCGVQRPIDTENNIIVIKLDHLTEFAANDGTGLTATTEVYLPVVSRASSN